MNSVVANRVCGCLASVVFIVAMAVPGQAQAPPGEAQSRPLEGLLIVAASPDTASNPRAKFASMQATMVHLDKNQNNPINWIPKGQAPTMFAPVASPSGRMFLFTYDDKQSDVTKREEYRIALPFQGLSYQLTPPFLRRGTQNDFDLRNFALNTSRMFSSRTWKWSPDSQRLYFSLGGERSIYSNGGAKQFAITGSMRDVYLHGFAHDSNHLLMQLGSVGMKARFYVAALPERRESTTIDELYRGAIQVALGEEYTGASETHEILYSPSGKYVAIVGVPRNTPNSAAVWAGPADQPRQVHLAKGMPSGAAAGEAPGTVLGQDVIRGTPPKAGQPYTVVNCGILALGWSQDGKNLYFRVSEEQGSGVVDAPHPNGHHVVHTNQIWVWNAERGAAKVMDIPIMTYYRNVGCPISHDERWLVLWGQDLPSEKTTSREHALRLSSDKPRSLFAVDLKSKAIKKLQTQNSNFDYATFTKPQRWEGEVFPGMNESKGKELPDNFVRFRSPVTMKSYEQQWVLEFSFEGNVRDFARRRDNLRVEATFYRPDGSPYRDTDGTFRNRDGLSHVYMALKGMSLSTSADAFNGSFFASLADLELIGSETTTIDVKLRLLDGDQLLGESKPSGRVTIQADTMPRTWAKNISITAATDNGEPGVLVTADVQTHKLTQWDVRFEAVVRQSDQRAIPAKNVAFRGTDDTAAAKVNVRPTREDQVIPVRLFLPLRELQLASGEHKVSVQLQSRLLEKNFVGATRQFPLTIRVP